MKRDAWLAQLKDGDLVVPVINGQRKEPVACRVTRTLVVIGKYAKAQRFSRRTGMLAGRKPMKHLFWIEPK